MLFAYHLGDLDDFHFPHCQWAADYQNRARIEEAVLIYNGSKIPTVMAFGVTPRFSSLLAELMELLPLKFLGHYQKEMRPHFHKTYEEKHSGSFRKMKLTDTSKAKLIKDNTGKNIIKLNESHGDELENMYQLAYPDGYFDRRMLATGKYFGYLDKGWIVSVAGVHVDSEEHSVTVLGSIATLPKFRNKGLATLVTARLLKELIGKRDVVMLNVDSKNSAAIKCYSNLGFVKTHEYDEGLFTLRK